MASTRAFKNLASLRNFMEEPVVEEPSIESADQSRPHRGILDQGVGASEPSATPVLLDTWRAPTAYATEPIARPKIDGRRKRKVLKVPSVSLSVAVRTEIHDDVSAMLFARKSTWIALLDELLTDYVKNAKQVNRFPK